MLELADGEGGQTASERLMQFGLTLPAFSNEILEMGRGIRAGAAQYLVQTDPAS